MTRVEHNPLRVECVFPNGDHWIAYLNRTPNPRLARDLAEAMVELIHPLGNVTRRIGAVQYACAIRRMVAELYARGFSGGVEELTRTQMLQYWMSVSGHRVQRTRGLLQACGNRLEPALREHLTGRPVKKPPRSKPHEPYTESQWHLLEQALTDRLHKMLADHHEVLALARLGPNPANRGMNRQNFAHLLHERGPLKTIPAAYEMSISVDAFKGGFGAQFVAIRSALFPSVEQVWVLRLLFGVYCGVVPDGIRDLGLQDLTWAGNHTLLLDYIKGRRGPESVNLPSRAVRLLERWLELSAPLRTFAPPECAEQLWIYTATRAWPGQPPERLGVLSPVTAPASGHKARRRLSDEFAFPTESGESLVLHGGRIRTTYQNVLARKGWTGRTRIDPNHTTNVEGSHYVSTTTPAQAEAVEAIIEDAQADILRRARPPIVLDDEEAAQFALSQPKVIERLGLDEKALAEWLSGERDVFTAACANQLAGLHGPKGKPCPARPWVCLLCPLALFTPRHAPNLLRLKAYFGRQSRLMTVDQFLAVFAPYADRLDHDILPRFKSSVLQNASTAVLDDDTELPLRPEEMTR